MLTTPLRYFPYRVLTIYLHCVRSLVICVWSINHIFTVGVLDVTKSFQNTILAPTDRVYFTNPPYYLQWFWWFEPWKQIKTSKRVQHVLQSRYGMQGTKISTQKGQCTYMWYLLILDSGICPIKKVYMSLIIKTNTWSFWWLPAFLLQLY